MVEQEKLSREEVLKALEIGEDILTKYEQELLMTDTLSSVQDSFTKEDLDSIKIMHKLSEAGMTYNEIKLLISFADTLKNVDFEGNSEIKNLLKLSPVYKLKQSLNLAKEELNRLKEKAKELEDALNKEINLKGYTGQESPSLLKAELETQQKKVMLLDKKLSETLLQNAHLETELARYKEGKNLYVGIKGKKAKELYQMLVQKEAELLDLKKKNEEILEKLEESNEENLELKEKIDLMEEDALEMEEEVEAKYEEQISGLRNQIENLIDKKQQEWDAYYSEINEQRKKELLTLQKKHEKEILRLKEIIKNQTLEINELKSFRNPVVALTRMVEKFR